MTDIVELAEAVAAELSNYHAEVMLCPEYELRDLEEMKVCVVPLSVEYKTVSRAAREKLMKVQIGFLKRGGEEELKGLLRMVEELGLGFLGKKLLDAYCIGVAYNPIYSPEHLRERGQFTSVIELAFKKIS